MASFGDILSRKWPGCQFTVRSTEILYWAPSNPSPAPTLEEVMAFSAEVDAMMVREGMKVTPRQFRLAMDAAGLLDDAEAIVAAAPRAAQISWEYAVMIERASPLIDAFAAQLRKTPEEVDALFAAAALVGD